MLSSRPHLFSRQRAQVEGKSRLGGGRDSPYFGFLPEFHGFALPGAAPLSYKAKCFQASCEIYLSFTVASLFLYSVSAFKKIFSSWIYGYSPVVVLCIIKESLFIYYSFLLVCLFVTPLEKLSFTLFD